MVFSTNDFPPLNSSHGKLEMNSEKEAGVLSKRACLFLSEMPLGLRALLRVSPNGPTELSRRRS